MCIRDSDTEIKVGKLIDTIEYDYPTFHLSMDCFWCEIVKGELVLKEHEAARWLTREQLGEVESVSYTHLDVYKRQGHITVSAERCADVLIFKVKDNGIGMDKQRLAEVCAMLKEDGNTKKENDGFGLFNVNQRIQLHYGTEYGLKVQSTYGEETEVWVRIPVRTESSS